MEMLEKVDLLRERADVTYEEAKNALEQSGGDLLDAMVLLERQGKVNGPRQSTYSTEYEEQKDYIRVRDKVEQQKRSAPSFGHTLGHLFRTIILFIRHTVFQVTKDDYVLISMPTIVFGLLLLFFWEGLVPIMVIALFFGVRYEFDGTESTKRANTVLNQAGEFADDLRDEFKKKTNGTQDTGFQTNGPQDTGFQTNGPQDTGFQANGPQEAEFRNTETQDTGFQGSEPQAAGAEHYDSLN